MTIHAEVRFKPSEDLIAYFNSSEDLIAYFNGVKYKLTKGQVVTTDAFVGSESLIKSDAQKFSDWLKNGGNLKLDTEKFKQLRIVNFMCTLTTGYYKVTWLLFEDCSVWENGKVKTG